MPNTGLMTGAEARKTWCPWARAAEPARWASQSAEPIPVASVNRGSDALMDASQPAHCMCLASDCAAWRWSHAPGRGYCGAAGPPGANMAGEAP